MRAFRFILFAGLLPLATLSVAEVWANESATYQDFRLQGFGSLGLVRASSDGADFVRDLSQPDGSRGRWTAKVDSLLGLQASYRIDDRWEAVAQVVSRYRYDGSFGPGLDWAFLKFDPASSLSLRGGRLGLEFYMQADSRLVGYSYLPVRLPVEYFAALPLYFIDGGDATLTVAGGEGLVRFKAYYGLAGEKFPVADRAWDFSGSQVSGGYVDYMWGAWQWRLSYAQLRFENDFPVNELRGGLQATGFASAATAADALSVVGKRAHYYSFGAVYDKGPLQAQLMLSRVRHESSILEDVVAGYGLLGYRFTSLTPYVGYSFAKSSAKNLATGLPDADPRFAVLNDGAAAAMRQSRVDQNSVFIGVRWDIRPNTALKIQWDRVRGTSDSTAFVQGEAPDWSGRNDVLSLKLDFVF